MTMGVKELLTRLKAKEIDISLNKEDLLVSFDGKEIEESLFSEIKQRKTEIISFLKELSISPTGISPITDLARIPLSHAQERLWFLMKLKQSSDYNMPFIFRVRGKLDKENFSNAIKQTIIRHRVLRTIIKEDDGIGYQIVQPVDAWRLESVQHDKQKDGDEKSNQFIESIISKPFELSADFMIRAGLIELGADDYKVIFSIHHIAFDAWSIPIFISELMTFYNAGVNELPVALPELTIQYADYSIWQRSDSYLKRINDKVAYWQKKLEGVRPVTLRHDFNVSPDFQNIGEQNHIAIDEKLTGQLKQFARDQDVTLFMILISCLKTMLHTYSGEKDICIGTPIAGRSEDGVQKLIGFFVNTLALRTTIDSEETFSETLRKVKQVVIEGFDNQDVPFEKVVESVKGPREYNKNPLFQVLFAFLNVPQGEAESVSNLSIDIEHSQFVPARFDISIEAEELNSQLLLNIVYKKHAYSRETINLFLKRYRLILSAFVSCPDLQIGKFKITDADEEAHILRQSSGLQTVLDVKLTFVHGFKACVEQFGSKTALICNGKELTYQELDERSERLADVLCAKGVQSDEIVGILLDHSMEMIVAIIAVLKNGSTYLPLDPNYPATRLQFMIDDSVCKIILTSGHRIRSSIFKNCKLVDVEICNSPLYEMTGAPKSIRSTAMAYLMYTSGSSGRAKACGISHKNLLNYILFANDAYNFDRYQRYACFSSISFDLTVTTIFCPLFLGKQVYIYSNNPIHQAIDDLFFDHHKIEVAKLTPSHISAIMNVDNRQTSMKLLIVGGEALIEGHIERVRSINQNIRLINEYGPTEATVGCSFKEIHEQHRNISIGLPVHNTQIYILDPNRNLSPIGVPGEIYIGGSGVSMGYFNNVNLTADKFIKIPFHIGSDLYKSGDRARWRIDGDIEYLGRIDEQRKIRGYRIELAEVHYLISSIECVEEVVVVAEEDDGEVVLTAYCRLKQKLSLKDFNEILADLLPGYMVPTKIIFLDNIPLNQNGKVDKDALKTFSKTQSAEDKEMPTTELQKQLALLWQNVLGKKEIRLNDDLFLIGGDSIRVIRLVSQINKQLGKMLMVKDVYENSTINKLSKFIENRPDVYWSRALSQSTTAVNSILSTEVLNLKKSCNLDDIFPASDVQAGMIFHGLLDEENFTYHDQNYYEFMDENFDLNLLQKAFEYQVQNHTILRTGFYLNAKNTILQGVHKYKPDVFANIKYFDLRNFDETQRVSFIKQCQRKDLGHFFEINGMPLHRMYVFQISHNAFGLLWSFHHAILDGWSNATLMTGLGNVYLAMKANQSIESSSLKISYKDFVIHEKAYSTLVELKEFWKTELKGVQRTPLPLRTKLDRLILEKRTQQVIEFQLGTDVLKELDSASQRYGMPLKHLYFSAFALLVSQLTDLDNIVIGLVTHGRPEIENSEKMVGCFLNSVPVRLEFSSNQRMADRLQLIHKKLIALKKYDKISLREISVAVGEEKGRRNPFFEVLFNYVDFHVYNQLDNRIKPLYSAVESFEQTNVFFNVTINRIGQISITVASQLYTDQETTIIKDCFTEMVTHIIRGDANGPFPMYKDTLKGNIPNLAPDGADQPVDDLIKHSGDVSKAGESYSSKQGVEIELLNIWLDVLGIEEVGENDDFFELGGDSLSMVRLWSYLKELDNQIKLKDILEFSTIRGQIDNLLNAHSND